MHCDILHEGIAQKARPRAWLLFGGLTVIEDLHYMTTSTLGKLC